jgi:hypothetical protein
MRLEKRTTDVGSGVPRLIVYIELAPHDLIREVAAAVEMARLLGAKVAFLVTDSPTVNSFIQSITDTDFVVAIPNKD